MKMSRTTLNRFRCIITSAKTVSAVATGCHRKPPSVVQTLMDAKAHSAFSIMAIVTGFTPKRIPWTIRLLLNFSRDPSAS